MCTTKKEKVFLLFAIICTTCFCEIGWCKRSDRSRGSRSRHGAQDLNVHYGAAGKISGDQQQQQQQQQQVDGTKIGSAPTALDSRFNSPPKDLGLDQVNKQAVDPLLSPNPQKPTGWNVGGIEVAQRSSGDLKTKASEDDLPDKINLGAYPSTTYPNTGSYNYYGVGDSYNYGNGYQSDSQQRFPGYRSTSNIGVVPPKGVNIADYYGSMLGYSDVQNAGIFGRLFSGQKQGYHGSYGFGNNAYKNVLAGLLIWNLMHGLTNYRYNVYNHYNQPEMIPKNMSLGAGEVVECPQNVTMICETSTRALCTTNGTIICISSPSESCTNTTEGVACAKNKNCVTNVTIVDEAGRESVFCVTTFGVRQVPEDDPCKSGNAELCLPNTSAESSVGLNVPEDTTAAS